MAPLRLGIALAVGGGLLSGCEVTDGEADNAGPTSTTTTTNGVTATSEVTGDPEETSDGLDDVGAWVSACCLPDASCEPLFGDENECIAFGGTIRDVSGCSTPCPTPVGACCSADSCSQLMRSQCTDSEFFTAAASCAEACPNAALGTCCFPGGCSEMQSEPECDDLNGDWAEGRDSCDTLCPDDAGGIPTGLFDAPAGVFGLEAPVLVQPGFAMTGPDQRPVILTGSGLVFVDLLTHRPIHEETIGPLFGALAFTAHADLLVTYGPSGHALCEWSDADNTWAFCGPNSGHFTDATLAGSGFSGDAWLDSAFSFGDVFVNRFAPDNSLSDSTWISAAAIAPVSANTVISAYAADRDGPALMVTNGAPGQFLFHDLANPDSPATFIGDIGNEPRKIRCLEPLCVISNLDGNLQRATWSFDAMPPVLVPGTVPVGVGPIGIDLIERGDNIAVVSTAFNDNTYSITEFDPLGAVVSNEERSVPDGCTGPGHAIWVPDGDALKILLTCNATDNYAVIDPDES